ncbi:MAG: hypothetical protein J6C43_03805 [Oscillospiraceae bacterium]|nr:hypothetical protein [Oscillospiraceae bacterium]
MTISEKVAYLKGLAEGLNLDTEKSKEGKLISVMIGILEEMGLSIEALENDVDDLGEELDAISDDLSDVEELVYDEDEDEDDYDFDDDDEDFFEVACPTCGADIVIDQDVLDAGTVECPSCGDRFALDLTDDEEKHCCGRGGHGGHGCCHKHDDEEADDAPEGEE